MRSIGPQFALTATLVVWVASGCSFAPAPEPVVPVDSIPLAFTEASDTGAYEAVRWWTAYEDPVLEALVDTVLVSNLDLAEAVARIGESRALMGVAAADLWPALNGALNASRQDNPANAGFGAILGALGGAGDSASAPGEGGEGGEEEPELPERPDRFTIEAYEATLGFSWELDFWGRARNDRKAALSDLLASEADFRAARIGVVAEAITAYYELQDLRNRIDLTREIVQVLEEREALTTIRYSRGLVSSFELYTVRQDLQSTQASLPQLRSQLGDARRRVALVAGRHMADLDLILPGNGVGGASVLAGEPSLPGSPIPAGIPADLLGQRPDVQAAGGRLEAARLRVGARRAEMLPSITLTGTAGLQSAFAENLFDLSQWFNNLAAGLTAPLFQGGRLRNNVEVARTRYAQQVAAYGRTVLTAVGEVEVALLRYREEEERNALLRAQLEQARASADLQAERYRSGVAAYTDYLDALRIQLNVQSTLSSSSRDLALARLGVHRALGGTWVEDPEEGESLAQLDDSRETP